MIGGSNGNGDEAARHGQRDPDPGDGFSLLRSTRRTRCRPSPPSTLRTLQGEGADPGDRPKVIEAMAKLDEEASK